MTKQSPAFLASSSAVENTFASGCAMIELAVAALDLRQRFERRLDAKLDVARTAAGALDQRRGKAFVVIDQHFQDMFGGELLVVAR